MTEERPKILVVDDSSTMRQLLVFALKRLGQVEIFEAADGIEGLKAAREHDVDVAIVDINMPLMDGLKMIHLIREDPQIAELPVVIITTEGSKDIKEKAAGLGVGHFITKPIKQAQVLDTIQGILQSK